MPTVFSYAHARAAAAVLVLLTGAWLFASRELHSGNATLHAAEPAGRTIEIPRCRIKLIDTAILASDRAGILDFVEPEEGHTVRPKRIIAALKSDIAEAALASAEIQASNDIEVRYAKKACELAKVELDKAIEANTKVPGAVTDVEIRRLRLAYDKSVLQIEQAAYQLKMHGYSRDEAKATLKSHQIEAPFEGIVTKVYRHKGEALRQGDPVLEVVSTSRVRVEGFVDAKYAWSIKSGALVKVRLDLGDATKGLDEQVFEGRIGFVDVTVQPVTRQVRIWAEVPNRNNLLRGGLTAQMMVFPDQVATPPTARGADKKVDEVAKER